MTDQPRWYQVDAMRAQIAQQRAAGQMPSAIEIALMAEVDRLHNENDRLDALTKSLFEEMDRLSEQIARQALKDPELQEAFRKVREAHPMTLDLEAIRARDALRYSMGSEMWDIDAADRAALLAEVDRLTERLRRIQVVALVHMAEDCPERARILAAVEKLPIVNGYFVERAAVLAAIEREAH